MDFNINNIAGVALIGSIVAFFNQIKAMILKVFSVFVRTDTVQGDAFRVEFLKDLLNQSKIIRWGNVAWITHQWNYISSYDADGPIFARKEGSLFLLYRNRTPLLVKWTGDGFSITYLWKTFDPKSLFDDAFARHMQTVIRQNSETPKIGFYVRETSGVENRGKYDEDNKRAQEDRAKAQSTPATSSESSFIYHRWMQAHTTYIGLTKDDINVYSKPSIIPAYYWSKQASQLRDEVGYWYENAGWFKDRGVRHCRGALLFGPGGTGKSKMVVEVAKHFQIPVHRINISGMNDKEFREAYHTNGERCGIILIEDIDAIFNGRENVLAKTNRTKSLLSFDTLINTIQGVTQNNGIFLIITTNHREKLDPSLIRPGRIDVQIEVKSLDVEGRQFIAANILRDWKDLQDKLVNECEGCTAAEVENKAVEMALTKFYEKRS